MVNTRHEWIAELSELSSAIAALGLKSRCSDEVYWHPATMQGVNADAYNLSASPEHNAAIASWAQGLADMRIASTAQLGKLVADLTGRNTYGTFAELAAYGLLTESEIEFSIQVPVTGKQILNPNGSEIDGCLEIGKDVLFDIKAFGLHEHLSKRLQERLSQSFPDKFIAISGSGDVGLSEMTNLLGANFRAIENELRLNARAGRGSLDIRLQPIKRVQGTSRSLNGYELAQNNAPYVFKFAKQFARRKPFMLVFVIHPWMGAWRLTHNFANDADNFLRSFARRSFMQFTRDRTKLLGVTRASASRLLSGIMIIDAWLDPKHDRKHRLFLNPRAKHPIFDLTREHLSTRIPNMSVDDFRFDDY